MVCHGIPLGYFSVKQPDKCVLF